MCARVYVGVCLGGVYVRQNVCTCMWRVRGPPSCICGVCIYGVDGHLCAVCVRLRCACACV